jgi:hypothetical protein
MRDLPIGQDALKVNSASIFPSPTPKESRQTPLFARGRSLAKVRGEITKHDFPENCEG